MCSRPPWDRSRAASSISGARTCRKNCNSDDAEQHSHGTATLAKRILEAVGRDYLIALDERGNEVTTLELAERFSAWLAGSTTNGRDIALVIGGADGLHSSIKQKADWLWGLSKLTLPHAMVRIILAEQLYRAYSVTQNHPYHRE